MQKCSRASQQQGVCAHPKFQPASHAAPSAFCLACCTLILSTWCGHSSCVHINQGGKSPLKKIYRRGALRVLVVGAAGAQSQGIYSSALTSLSYSPPSRALQSMYVCVCVRACMHLLRMRCVHSCASYAQACVRAPLHTHTTREALGGLPCVAAGLAECAQALLWASVRVRICGRSCVRACVHVLRTSVRHCVHARPNLQALRGLRARGCSTPCACESLARVRANAPVHKRVRMRAYEHPQRACPPVRAHVLSCACVACQGQQLQGNAPGRHSIQVGCCYCCRQ